MKKLLFTGLLALGLITTGCYKDNYDQAVITIEQLERKIAGLENELQSSIMDTETKALELANLEAQIIELDNTIVNLDSTIVSLEGENEDLINNLLNLEERIAELNADILVLIEQRDDRIQHLQDVADGRTAVLEEEISDLTQQIEALEERTAIAVFNWVGNARDLVRVSLGLIDGQTVNVNILPQDLTIEQLQDMIDALSDDMDDMTPAPSFTASETTALIEAGFTVDGETASISDGNDGEITITTYGDGNFDVDNDEGENLGTEVDFDAALQAAQDAITPPAPTTVFTDAQVQDFMNRGFTYDSVNDAWFLRNLIISNDPHSDQFVVSGPDFDAYSASVATASHESTSHLAALIQGYYRGVDAQAIVNDWNAAEVEQLSVFGNGWTIDINGNTVRVIWVWVDGIQWDLRVGSTRVGQGLNLADLLGQYRTDTAPAAPVVYTGQSLYGPGELVGDLQFAVTGGRPSEIMVGSVVTFTNETTNESWTFTIAIVPGFSDDIIRVPGFDPAFELAISTADLFTISIQN